MDNKQYSDLLEYLFKGQLPKEADKIYEKWQVNSENKIIIFM